MFDCNNLVHPFQNDPGCSQSQRVMEDLLASASKIDGRTLADLLNYFTELSPHIKYYYVPVSNTQNGTGEVLKESNWSVFFKDSIPFQLAAATKNNANSINEKYSLYGRLFQKNPSVSGLQLLIRYFYYSTFYKINNLYTTLQNTGLPDADILGKLIKHKLQLPLIQFINATTAAFDFFGIKNIDFKDLYKNNVWGITTATITDARNAEIFVADRQQQLMVLKNAVDDSFNEVVKLMDVIANMAAVNIEPGLQPLQDELKQKQTPHIALLFTFLKLFRHLQDDLNGFTKKHLDFFYQDVLQLKPNAAQPDKVYLIFELQKQLKQYALKKGLLVKADKDKNNTEIDFALNEDIVVNEAQVADQRTLFLNNKPAGDDTYVEGVYMAPAANTADGIDQDFADDSLKNYPTLGARFSKLLLPGTNAPKVYPPARIGFVLASPVLLLNEGEREIDITLTCTLLNDCNETNSNSTIANDPCCKNNKQSLTEEVEDFPAFIDPARLLPAMRTVMSDTYIYISNALVDQAKMLALTDVHAKSIRDKFLLNDDKSGCPKPVCCDNAAMYLDDVVVTAGEWNDFVKAKRFTDAEQAFLFKIFTPFKPFKVLFSGDKDWIDPMVVVPTENGNPIDIELLNISIPGPDAVKVLPGEFMIKIVAKITADKPAITFYNKENLKEDLGTTQPLVKIELNDAIKLALVSAMYDQTGNNCCLNTAEDLCRRQVSLYHFFRATVVKQTNITVTVCGLKNFIVQNDESVQDINGPVYPFGTRPSVIGFDAVYHREDDSRSTPDPKVPAVKDAVAAEPVKLTDGDNNGGNTNTAIKKSPNLVGPNFYIGSPEIFSKRWQKMCVKLNWKDKPADFNEYYRAYLTRYGILNCDKIRKKDDIYGLNECDFQVNLAVLDNGKWIKEIKDSPKIFIVNAVTKDNNRLLFEENNCGPLCIDPDYKYSFFIEPKDFGVQPTFDENMPYFKKYEVATKKGFVRITLENQDFLHKDYAFVLSRQMMALGKFPDAVLEGAAYAGTGNTVIVYKDMGGAIINFAKLVDDTATSAAAMKLNADNLFNDYNGKPENDDTPKVAQNQEAGDVGDEVKNNQILANITSKVADSLKGQLDQWNKILKLFDTNGNPTKDLSVIIPNEPWTPIISNMSLGYTAAADKTDITLIHLYPYQNTYKQERLSLAPRLFPTLCDEGTLFIGLSNVVPGSNINMLFQLAEATSDSEADPQEIFWKYLYNNQWFSLRTGFEILADATDNLTSSGIIKFAFPQNISTDNTVMPAGLSWIKAAVPKNSRAVCETISINTQAMEATFVIGKQNDTARLSSPLPENSVANLAIADASVKQVTQPYASFDGALPEETKQYYVRVSELLRHKGRAIQKFDYERLVLENFSQVFKTKCINHSFRLDANKFEKDFPIAPGYVLLAVIPDLTKLLAAQSFEPKLPTGLLEKIQVYLAARTSPFVKLKVVNPRYEKINFCISVILHAGYDKDFYKHQLAQDLREFLAPWAVGKYDKLTFGECINKSDIVYFLETRDYLNYITKLQMQLEGDLANLSDDTTEICPRTPRSILLAGEVQVCIEEETIIQLKVPVYNNKPTAAYAPLKQGLVPPLKIRI